MAENARGACASTWRVRLRCCKVARCRWAAQASGMRAARARSASQGAGKAQPSRALCNFPSLCAADPAHTISLPPPLRPSPRVSLPRAPHYTRHRASRFPQAQGPRGTVHPQHASTTVSGPHPTPSQQRRANRDDSLIIDTVSAYAGPPRLFYHTLCTRGKEHDGESTGQTTRMVADDSRSAQGRVPCMKAIRKDTGMEQEGWCVFR